jgi:hypothetical protein
MGGPPRGKRPAVSQSQLGGGWRRDYRTQHEADDGSDEFVFKILHFLVVDRVSGFRRGFSFCHCGNSFFAARQTLHGTPQTRCQTKTVKLILVIRF